MSAAGTSPEPPVATAPAPASRGALEATLAALALWVQLGLLPLLSARARVDGWPLGPALAALAALAAVLAAPRLAGARPALAVVTLLAAFPALVALEAMLLGVRAVAHFDGPSRVVAGLTAVAATLLTARWAGGLPRSVRAQVAASPPINPRPSGPRWQRAALAALALQGYALALLLPAALAPSAVSARRDTGFEVGGALLARTRDALLSAGGLLLALVVVVSAGTALTRRRATQRSASRAFTFALWAAGLLAVLWMLRGPTGSAQLR